MDIKSNQEHDPSRCRDLRQINRDINRQIRELSEDRRNGIRPLRAKKSERDRPTSERKSLRSQLGGATFAAVASVDRTVTQALRSNQSSPLAKIHARLSEVNRAIGQLNSELAGLTESNSNFNNDQVRLDSRLAQNASQMNALNCVV